MTFLPTGINTRIGNGTSNALHLPQLDMAGTTRFRPVLMTALAMIFGMVLMATGYSQNAPLGRAVIRGLLVATVFTLFFVPCVYAIFYIRRTARQQEDP